MPIFILRKQLITYIKKTWTGI